MLQPPGPSHVRRRGRPSAASARSVPRRPLAPGAALPLRSQPQRERLLARSERSDRRRAGGLQRARQPPPPAPRSPEVRPAAQVGVVVDAVEGVDRRLRLGRSAGQRGRQKRSACPLVSSVATSRGAPVGSAARRTACKSCLTAVDAGIRMLTSSTDRLRAPASSSRAAGVMSTPSTRWVQ